MPGRYGHWRGGTVYWWKYIDLRAVSPSPVLLSGWSPLFCPSLSSRQGGPTDYLPPGPNWNWRHPMYIWRQSCLILTWESVLFSLSIQLTNNIWGFWTVYYHFCVREFRKEAVWKRQMWQRLLEKGLASGFLNGIVITSGDIRGQMVASWGLGRPWIFSLDKATLRTSVFNI